MCGIAGFAGIADSTARFRLVLALGAGIDMRGGHAAGYVALAGKTLRYAKKAGEWSNARYRFLLSASRSDMCLMHARFATCGIKHAVEQAHPFAIRREGKVALWGVHNGVIFDAWDSAKWHGRKIEVDSQELFELIADEEFDTLKQLEGYGIAIWIDANKNHINLARLSNWSEICVVGVQGGGIVWGSTWSIVADALEEAELHADFEYKLDEIGQVYHITPEKVQCSNTKGVRVAASFMSSFNSKDNKFTEDDDAFMKEMESNWDRWFKDDKNEKIQSSKENNFKTWSSGNHDPWDDEETDMDGRFLLRGM